MYHLSIQPFVYILVYFIFVPCYIIWRFAVIFITFLGFELVVGNVERKLLKQTRIFIRTLETFETCPQEDKPFSLDACWALSPETYIFIEKGPSIQVTE